MEKDQEEIMQIVGIGNMENHGEIFARQTKQKIGYTELHAVCAVGHTYFHLVSIRMVCVPMGTQVKLVSGGMEGVTMSQPSDMISSAIYIVFLILSLFLFYFFSFSHVGLG